MKNIIRCFVLVSCLFFSTSVLSAGEAKNLGSCMVNSLNGKERTVLAKWIFLAMASHPDIKTYSKASTRDIDKTDKKVGKLITRLLTRDCPEQLKKANKSDPLAVKKSFELVGRVAMQELMTNQNVMKAITNYARYTDIKKINALLAGK